VIKHDNVSRSLDVTASVRGRSLDAVVGEVKNRVRAMAMPLEFHAEVRSDTQRHQQGQFWRVGAVAFAVALGIFLVLQAAFGSWRLAALLFLTLPVSVVGGVLAAGLVGGVRSLGALMGLLAIFAIAARNNVLLIRTFGRSAPPDADLVVRVTRDRVAPIVLTALTMVAALLPLLFLGRVAGTEALFPFAVVVMGGLVTSTLLSVLILPRCICGSRRVFVRTGIARLRPRRARASRREGCDAPPNPLAGLDHRSRRSRPRRLRFERKGRGERRGPCNRRSDRRQRGRPCHPHEGRRRPDRSEDRVGANGAGDRHGDLAAIRGPAGGTAL
jgi:hypothetical protein